MLDLVGNPKLLVFSCTGSNQEDLTLINFIFFNVHRNKDKELSDKIAMQTQMLEQQEQQRVLEEQQKERLAIQQQAMLLQQQKQQQMSGEPGEHPEDFMEKVRQQQMMLEAEEQQRKIEQQQKVNIRIRVIMSQSVIVFFLFFFFCFFCLFEVAVLSCHLNKTQRWYL